MSPVCYTHIYPTEGQLRDPSECYVSKSVHSVHSAGFLQSMFAYVSVTVDVFAMFAPKNNKYTFLLPDAVCAGADSIFSKGGFHANVAMLKSSETHGVVSFSRK